jgi:adenosyl cobinamide kinase/adenosyl cobinamide phosphate guanylyltransferase
MTRIFVTGASRSGKSSWAERRVRASGLPVTYIATGPQPSADDPEWAARVAAHRRRRPSEWTTVETLDFAPHLTGSGGAVLVDCLTLWLAGVMTRCAVWDAAPDSAAWARLAEQIDALVDAWAQATGLVVAVTNEVGWGIVPEHRSGRLFRDEMGVLNSRIAALSDEAWLLTAGIPMQLR